MLFKGFVFGDDRNNSNHNDDGLCNGNNHGQGHSHYNNNNDDDDHIPTNIVTLLMAYAETSDEWYKHVDTQRHYQGQQSLWRMIRMSQRDSHLRESACFSAWNYPQMPNRKDPSDHFALCIDVRITPTTTYTDDDDEKEVGNTLDDDDCKKVNKGEDEETEEMENGRNSDEYDSSTENGKVTGAEEDDEYHNWTVCD